MKTDLKPIIQATNVRSMASSVDVASMPEAFIRHRPLDTWHFITEARRRGLDLDLSTLRRSRVDGWQHRAGAEDEGEHDLQFVQDLE